MLLLVVAMPCAPSCFLLLVVRSGATMLLLVVAMPCAPSCFLLLVVRSGATIPTGSSDALCSLLLLAPGSKVRSYYAPTSSSDALCS